VYCFEKNTNKRLWVAEDQFENQIMITEQFKEIPLLLGVAMVYNNAANRYGIKVVAIDKQTGKTRYERELSNNNGQFQSLRTDYNKGTIELWNYGIRVVFSPEEGSKAPSSNEKSSSNDRNEPNQVDPVKLQRQIEGIEKFRLRELVR
jgi:hypothetical protein